ncbi:hypothetical protein GSU68_02255 [Rathayibacter sp. VKM Ac-2759]|uniref:hypothetical protein n=1 Tax=Rathayibacter sp. VKM Ac-2759 TaxID=2609252 RepID=UPI001318F7CD|nr:hypothetical protein [Rathayibacter sp. VKM Ac-2759]QHC65516.1 hypothetical protein GSU68_02255 [Rathayibacter sp. VKM Ac-2759]
MDGAAAIERADELWREGRRAAALNFLCAHVRRFPSEQPTRLALITRYREIGAPDQAGRWGLALDGQTSDFERDRAARLLAGAGLLARDLPKFLALPTADLPQQVRDLLPSVERYREQFHREHPENEPVPEDWRQFAATALWLLSAGLAGVVIVVVWGGALLGVQMTEFARWGGVVYVGVAALGCGAQGWWRLRSGPRARGWLWLVATALVTAGIVFIVATAAQNAGAIKFTWET